MVTDTCWSCSDFSPASAGRAPHDQLRQLNTPLDPGRSPVRHGLAGCNAVVGGRAPGCPARLRVEELLMSDWYLPLKSCSNALAGEACQQPGCDASRGHRANDALHPLIVPLLASAWLWQTPARPPLELDHFQSEYPALSDSIPTALFLLPARRPGSALLAGGGVTFCKQRRLPPRPSSRSGKVFLETL